MTITNEEECVKRNYALQCSVCTRKSSRNISQYNNNNNDDDDDDYDYYYYYYYYCIIVSFIQGSHTHIPETNHVPRGYIVTAILSLLFMVPLCLVPAFVLLFFYVSTFRSMCAVPNMAVFCSSLTSWFPGMSLTYFFNDLEMTIKNYQRDALKLFIRQILLLSSTCFEYQVLIFRRT